MGKKGIPHRKWSKEEKMKIIKLHLEEHIPVCEIERQYSISNNTRFKRSAQLAEPVETI